MIWSSIVWYRSRKPVDPIILFIWVIGILNICTSSHEYVPFMNKVANPISLYLRRHYSLYTLETLRLYRRNIKTQTLLFDAYCVPLRTTPKWDHYLYLIWFAKKFTAVTLYCILAGIDPLQMSFFVRTRPKNKSPPPRYSTLAVST